jgi:hypothetical protein
MPSIGQRIRDIVGNQFGAEIVEQTIEKAIQDARDRAAPPTSTFYDPLSIFMGRDWLTKSSHEPLTTLELRAMAKNPIISSIIQTRIQQVASFCAPKANPYDIGFEIKSDDTEAKKDVQSATEIKNWLYQAGIPGYGEDLLETFARKFIRDSLTLDQACGEIVLRRNGTPAYFVAVDAATIRRLPASLDFATPSGKEPVYAQIMNDQITARFTRDEMIFGIRNPSTDVLMAGYGTSELETLIRTITTIFNAERYNSSQLSQGGTSKGVLVVKGEVNDRDQFTSFKRDFRAAVSNATQNWRPPVINVSKDAEVDWVALDRSNRDMEFAQLFDFLVKQACGVYQIDPHEINWSINSSGAQTVFEGRQQQKIQASLNRGLKPLLIFLGNQLNQGMVSKIDPRFRVEFSGVDQDRQADAEGSSACPQSQAETSS